MINVFKILPPSVRFGFRLPQQCHKTLSKTKTKYYKVLQSITKYYKVLQSITKTNLAHLLGPIFGLVFTLPTQWPISEAVLKSNYEVLKTNRSFAPLSIYTIVKVGLAHAYLED